MEVEGLDEGMAQEQDLEVGVGKGEDLLRHAQDARCRGRQGEGGDGRADPQDRREQEGGLDGSAHARSSVGAEGVGDGRLGADGGSREGADDEGRDGRVAAHGRHVSVPQ